MEDLDTLEALQGADEETIREFEMEQFAESGVLPQRIFDSEDSDEPLTDVVICSSISGDGILPSFVTLQKRSANGVVVSRLYQPVEK